MPDPEKKDEKPGEGTPPGDPPTPKPDPQPPQGDVLHFTPKALNERLARAQDVARREAEAEQKQELDKQAQAMGYPNHAAMVDDLKRLKTAPKPEPKPDPNQDPQLGREERKSLVKAQARILELEGLLTAEQDARRRAERDLKAIKQRSDASDARHALEKSAMRAGIVEVDYAVELLVKAQNGKSQPELDNFDDSKFFEDLRKDKPFLFAVEERPAKTGAGSGNPPAPGPGKTQKTAAEEEQVDARKLDGAAYQARLKALGINPNSQPA